MTLHNITGREEAGPHVVIRIAGPRRRSSLFWIGLAVQLVAVSLPVILLLAMTA